MGVKTAAERSPQMWKIGAQRGYTLDKPHTTCPGNREIDGFNLRAGSGSACQHHRAIA